ncbi:MAG: sensor histidine kinase [Aquabacterium sp.]
MRRAPGPPPIARIALDLGLYALWATAGAAVGASRRARDRERSALRAEAELARARLAALQLQLNPHFLFNALNGISSLIHTDPHAADNMLADLSQLLRAAIDTAATERIALARELEVLDCYLDIERRRFRHRLHVDKQIEGGALGSLVPTFMLQPLVENAIKHGVERKRGGGKVVLRAQRTGQRLRLAIEDDGPGLSSQGTASASTGVGLANTRQRLQQLYGADFVLTIGDAPAGGCIVTIDLPFDAAGQASQAQAQGQGQGS